MVTPRRSLLRGASLALALTAAVGCKKPAPPPPPPVVRAPTPPPAPAAGYEVEMWGTLTESLRAPRYIVVLTHAPCDPKLLGTTHLSAIAHPDPAEPIRSFYVEPVVRNGERLNLCAATLNAEGTLVTGYGSYPKNPILFEKKKPAEEEDDDEDDDDLVLRGLDFEVHPLTTPLSLPEGRF